jgi:hypothetical protein
MFCDGCGRYLGWGDGPAPETVQVPVQPPQPSGPHAAVDVRFKSDLIEVAPGNAKSATFSVKNLGNQVEEFRLSVAGPTWIVVDPVVMGVYPGDEVTGTIQAAPPRKPSSVAGVTPFRLTATSSVHRPSVSSSAAGRVDVAPYYELAPELVPTSSNGRGLTHHHIELDNRGNVPLRIELNSTDVADGLRLGVPAVADVGPGQVVEVPVSVYGTRRWFGRPEPKTFSIIAEAPKPLAANRLSGTRIVAPVFPRWVPAVAAGLVVAAVAAAVLVPKLTSHNPPPPPPGSSSAAVQSSLSSSSPATNSSSASSSSASSSSATGGSASASQVPVPDVAGDTLQLADSMLTGAHLVPHHVAFYDSSSPGSTNVVRTNPAANAIVSAGSPVQVFVPIQHYDMITAAAQAQWMATSQFTPPSAAVPVGVQTGSAGNVFVLASAVLEDGTVATQALETRPPPVASGTISGLYRLGDPTMDQEEFRADIGFLRDTPADQTIRYQVVVTVGGSTSVLLTGTHTSGSGSMEQPAQVLPAGTTAVELRVTTLDSTSAKDDIVWYNPRIEEANAQAEPSRSTAPASSPPPTSTGP